MFVALLFNQPNRYTAILKGGIIVRDLEQDKKIERADVINNNYEHSADFNEGSKVFFKALSSRCSRLYVQTASSYGFRYT